MRRTAVLFFILAACLLLAPAALAAPAAHDPGGGGPVGCWTFDFGLAGSVTAVDAAAGTVTVALEHGTDGLPASVDVKVDGDTRITRAERFGGCGCDILTLDDIAVGDEVLVAGSTDDSVDPPVYTAAFIVVHAPCFGLVGTVTDVDVDNGLLTVAVDEGSGDLSGEVKVVVNDETRIVESHHRARGCDTYEEPLTLGDVSVGDTVGVWGTVDKSGDAPVYTAERVCIRVPRFGLVGTVVSRDAENGLLDVAIDHASGDLTGTIEVSVSADTELFQVGGHERTAITLADVQEGDEVAVFGTVDVSSGSEVYTAHVVLDGVPADLPHPRCKPADAAVAGRDAGRGDKVRLRLKVADAMPGCATAKVTLKIKDKAGRTVATRTVTGVVVNQSATVGVKLGKALRRGAYRLIATSVDWAGNRQVRAASARLTVK
jgi:hypothetical protein